MACTGVSCHHIPVVITLAHRLRKLPGTKHLLMCCGLSFVKHSCVKRMLGYWVVQCSPGPRCWVVQCRGCQRCRGLDHVTGWCWWSSCFFSNPGMVMVCVRVPWIQLMGFLVFYHLLMVGLMCSPPTALGATCTSGLLSLRVFGVPRDAEKSV